MKKDTELLQYVNRNAKMGGDNLETVLKDVKRAEMRDIITDQIAEYRSVEKQAEDKLVAMGEKPDENKISGMCVRMMINAKTMMDSSCEHIAEMIIKGSTAGIIDITKQLKEYSDCDADAVNLAFRLKGIEQKNLDEMKHYL